MYGQIFQTGDLAVVGLLVVLEGVLSIDNALVLGLLARRLPKRLQKRALTYGLVGAFVFRFIAIGTASFLLRWNFVKLLGGGYLLWVAVKYFWSDHRNKKEHSIEIGSTGQPVLIDEHVEREPPRGQKAGFWSTVAVIELTDIAFAIDSILAALALVGSAPVGHVGPHPKLWVVVTGGMLGVILMRFAAVIFIKLLDRFPRFETSAYLLVATIGLKLLADWGLNTPAHPHRADFHSPGSPAFWIFWVTMLICFLTGFLPQKQKNQTA
jgi:YkoY family integral membrane protein